MIASYSLSLVSVLAKLTSVNAYPIARRRCPWSMGPWARWALPCHWAADETPLACCLVELELVRCASLWRRSSRVAGHDRSSPGVRRCVSMEIRASLHWHRV